MQWWDAWWSMLLAGAVLFVPGLALGWVMNLRRLALAAAAPVLSISLVSVAAIVSAFFGIAWSVLPVLALTAVAMLLVGLGTRLLPLRYRVRQSRRPFAVRQIWTIAALAVAAIVIAGNLMLAIGRPESISQTYDNIFHLNAIRYIADTGQASSFTIGRMTGESFYPAAWHDFVSLVFQLSGSSIPQAVSSGNIVIGALAWPLGAVQFSRTVLPKTPAATWIAASAATAFGVFPMILIDFGVLYPTFLAYALLPACIAFLVKAIGIGAGKGSRRAEVWLALIMMLPGLSLAHPSALMVLVALSVPLVGYVSWRALPMLKPRWQQAPLGTGARLGLIVLWAAGALVLWNAVRPPADAAFWPPTRSPAGAVVGVFSNAVVGLPPAIFVSAFLILGLLVALRRKQLWWLAGQFLLIGFLFVVVSSFSQGGFRNFFTGIWYNDQYRLAALLPLISVPIASLGAYRAYRYFRRLQPVRMLRGRSAAFRWSAGFLGLLAMLLATQLGNVSAATQRTQNDYLLSSSSALLTNDEMSVLQRVPDLVPKRSVVVGNPANGSSLVYAFADRVPMQYHVLSAPLTEDQQLVLDHLDEAKDNPAVCAAVRRLNIGYVLDFGTQEVNFGSHPTPGLTGAEAAGVAAVELQVGTAKLLRVTACQ
jgi:hypothetical protein